MRQQCENHFSLTTVPAAEAVVQDAVENASSRRRRLHDDRLASLDPSRGRPGRNRILYKSRADRSRVNSAGEKAREKRRERAEAASREHALRGEAGFTVDAQRPALRLRAHAQRHASRPQTSPCRRVTLSDVFVSVTRDVDVERTGLNTASLNT